MRYPIASWLFAPAALAILAALLGAAPEGTIQMTGQLHPAGGGSVEGMQVAVRSGSRVDSAAVDARGRFSLRVPAPPRGQTVEVRVDARHPLGRRFHPSVAHVPVGALEGEYSVVLVPMRWTVRTGAFAGRTVEISLSSAFQPAGRQQSSFYRHTEGRSPSNRPAPIASWPEGVFPIRVAFDRSGFAGAVAARDSAEFWNIVQEMEEEFGRDLFRPARAHETQPDDRGGPEDVIHVIMDPGLRAVGWGTSISQGGDILYGTVRVRDGGVFSGYDAAGLIKHELMHALGAGHTCSWTSALADIRVCAARRASRLTPEDVAYLQLLIEVREIQRALKSSQAMEAALAGERMEME